VSLVTHSRPLSSSCLSSASLPAPSSRSLAACGVQFAFPFSSAPSGESSGSALPCAHGWRGGWGHAHVAAPPSCSARVVCLLPSCAAATAVSRPSAGATAGWHWLLPAQRSDERVQRSQHPVHRRGSGRGWCVCAVECRSACVVMGEGSDGVGQKQPPVCAPAKTSLPATSERRREQTELCRKEKHV